MANKGIALSIPLLVFAFVVTILLLIIQGVIEVPFLSRHPRVELQSEYKNPFARETQYVNPFSGYKNPFDNLR